MVPFRIQASVVALISYALISVSCNQGQGGGRESLGGSPGGVGPEGGGTTGGSGIATSLEFSALATSVIFTKEANENTCVPFVLTALNDGAASASVGVKFELQTSDGMSGKGSVTPESGTTDEKGQLSAAYCSGESEGQVVVLAKAGTITANSSRITVSRKPVYEFKYVRSDVDPILTPGDGEKDEDVLYLNLFDSGPQDCTTVYFKLSKSGAPMVGSQLKFQTQIEFPKGAKLGKRDEAVKTETDSRTGKKFAVYTATSTSSGEFPVPVCAGVSLGTMLISGTFTDEDMRTYTANSPVVRITAGLTNYINMSLTFDLINGRTLRGYFNTNSSYQLPLTVQMGARQDGNPITDYPVEIATEIGRYSVEDGGIPDKVTGAAKLKLQSLHLVGNYPYMVNTYAGFPLAQTRCDPQQLAQWGTAQGVASINYSDLRKNWRSTMVYSIRGQEHFNDANRNGIYNAGGDGFWDKNQNGYFDTGDVLTFDGGNDGLFNQNGEWFIDLPTPFIDVDEDGAFTASKDIVIGDEYQAPNGKRDADTVVWKYEYFPISMGPSVYGLQRYRIQTANYTSADATVTYNGTSYPIWGLSSVTTSTLFGSTDASTSAAVYRGVIFAHDLCGNLLPGGTELSVSFEVQQAPQWGARNPIAQFYIQPGDQLLEPSRYLIKGSSEGSSKGVINFNSVDHPAGQSGYPVVMHLEVPPCLTLCTGDVNQSNPGRSCDGYSAIARLLVKENALGENDPGSWTALEMPFSFGAVNDCNCAGGATKNGSGCVCPTGQTVNSSGNCAAP
jgi:hypothetical protein